MPRQSQDESGFATNAPAAPPKNSDVEIVAQEAEFSDFQTNAKNDLDSAKHKKRD
jgi:hypothetical protein